MLIQRQTRSFQLLLLLLATLTLLLLFTYHQAPLGIIVAPASPASRINANNLGQWGPLIPVPLVPAAMAVLPQSGRLLMWAADSPNAFNNAEHTLTASYDPSTATVTPHDVISTHHNMFCPGLSLDAAGRPIVTGGSTSARTSVFDDTQNEWRSLGDLYLPRGYHSQATLSDGRIFTIGGSWSGGLGGKHGEVFDPARNEWSPLPGCRAEPLLTNDSKGVFAADNHAWLFAWRRGSVFQAGPSSAMNWYATDTHEDGEAGAHFPAGLRARSRHSMNGNAAMFDAHAGRILTLGGAEHYAGATGTNTAHLVTLGSTSKERFPQPTVEELSPMHAARVYVNSVVLPTGDVLVTGGSSFAQQWSDVNASVVPEMWSANMKKFVQLSGEGAAPRTYHSSAVLMPDATVVTGGGGLCWVDCRGVGEGVNHYNIQVFSPPYLFESDGVTRAHRRRILAVSQTVVSIVEDAVSAGSVDVIDVDVDGQVAEFSLVRYGSATHSINTDQRRVPLDFTCPGKMRTNKEDIKAWGCRVSVPRDAGIVIPGYWMLFAISPNGVPSVATTLLLKLERVE